MVNGQKKRAFYYFCNPNDGKVKVHYDLEHWQVKDPVITIGTYDGLHLGHRRIIEVLRETAGRTGGESVVFTFWPHPRIVLGKTDSQFRLINTLEEKIWLLKKLGIDHLVIYPFTPDFASLTACRFVEEILVARCAIRQLVIGYNHHFGRDREGGYDVIRRCASENGFEVQRIDAATVSGEKLSSTEIRKALLAGDILKANLLLGEPFPIHGLVDRGNGLGREMGFPTANIRIPDERKMIPLDGVYAVHVELGSRQLNGMMNIGFRPTLHEISHGRTVEVHIFDFNEDLYGKSIRLSVLKRIREEKKFDGINALREQLTLDRQEVLRFLANPS